MRLLCPCNQCYHSAATREPLNFMAIPTTTLYLKNLNERIPQSRLREEIAELCKPHGPVVKIFTGRGLRKRGQAFVAFQDLNHALEAQRSLDGRLLFEKPIEAAFALTASNKTSLSSSCSSHVNHPTSNTAIDAPACAEADPEGPPKLSSSSTAHNPVDAGTPNSRILLQNVPDSIDLNKLIDICAPFPGYSEARMFAARHVGFIDFESVEAASLAIGQLSQKGIGEIKYAKK